MRDILFLQKCDIDQITIRLDYKPKRIDMKRIRLGQFVELMNLFRLEETELVLPAATLTGVNGWDHFAQELFRAWLPALNGPQASHILAGISPVRTLINLGNGVSDLILLPVQHYSGDGRVIRGLERGTKSFLKNTVMEGARIGAKLSSGTKIVLEHLDEIFTGEPDASSRTVHLDDGRDGRVAVDHPPAFSVGVVVPCDAREGLKMAYESLSRNAQKTMHTIVAIPVQVYERSGPGGAVKAVVRAVPIAILRPLIGASEAMSMAMQGVQNSINPTRGIEIRRKYKKG